MKKNKLTKRKLIKKTRKNKKHITHKHINSHKHIKNKSLYTRKYKRGGNLEQTSSEKIEAEIQELMRRIEALKLQNESLQALQNKRLIESQDKREKENNLSHGMDISEPTSKEVFEEMDISEPTSKEVFEEIDLSNGVDISDTISRNKTEILKNNFDEAKEIPEEIKREIAMKKIGQFIKYSKKFLQIVCSNSGECIAFGNYIKELNHFFKGFVNFEYAISPVIQIGEVSANGFVKQIEYMRDDYKAYAILKSSQNADSDNLLYEYVVGIKYINRIMISFPCFLQTYGLYFYNSDYSWKMMQKKEVDILYLKNLILQNKIDYIKGCQESKYAAILIQHIFSAKSLHHMLLKVPGFIADDLFFILFIIYQALSSLSKTFTHYDLHTNNILIYKPAKDGYIKYYYYDLDGSIIEFNSPYIPKIIDYGRSYFDNGNINSLKIYNHICSINKCNPRCGELYGFEWLNPNPSSSSFYINSSKKNESHDLRLIYLINSYINKNSYSNNIFNLLKPVVNSIVYGVGINSQKYKEYGTEENLNMDTTRITNVNSLHNVLKEIVKNPDVISENKNKYNDNPLYELHIYYDQRPMKIVQNR
jgi:hypothetical protein